MVPRQDFAPPIKALTRLSGATLCVGGMPTYITVMRHVPIIALCSTLISAPVAAHEPEEGEGGLSLMERGAQMLLEGLAEEVGPALDDLRGMADTLGPAARDFVAHMGPALAELLSKIDDITVYHPPEMLPNGDIIIRRKTPEELAEPESEEIEL